MAFWSCVIFAVFQTGHLLPGPVSNGKHERSFHRQITFPLKASSENICTGTSGNGRKFGISQRDVQLMFFKYFRGMSRVLSPAPSKPWQNLWSPAASGSHYPCHLPNKLPYWAPSWSAGVSKHNYCYITFSQYAHTIVPVVVIHTLVCDVKATKEDFHVINACYSVHTRIILPSKTTERETSVNNRNPPPVWGGFPVPV